MNRSPSDRILEEWDVAARGVVQPAEAPRRRGLVGLAGPGGLVPLLATAIVVAVAVTWLGSRAGVDVGTASPTPTTSQVAVVPPSPSPAPSEGASCETELRAVIRSWEGAAGSRIATVTLTNEGAVACSIPVYSNPALIDGHERVLAQGVGMLADGTVTLDPGGSVATEVAVANVCGQPPIAPV